MSSCIGCSPGTYANQTTWEARTDPLKETCVPCPIGFISSLVAAAVCVPCPATSEASSPGLSECTMCPSGKSSDGVGGRCEPNPPDDTGKYVLIGVAAGLALVGSIVGIRRMIYLYKKYKRQEEEAAALITSQVKSAAESVSEFQAPCVLMKGSDFVQQNALRPHEELREEDLLVFVDTVETLEKFVEGRCTVFFSHQWCGWSDPDPNRIQFPAMVAAIKMVAEKEQCLLDTVYVWAEYAARV